MLQAFTMTQRYEHLLDALRRVSELYPRPNVRGRAYVRQGDYTATLPLDFYRGTAQQLSNLASLIDVYQAYTFPYITDDTGMRVYFGQYVPVSTNERGRYCVSLASAAASDASYDIVYDAMHLIANDGLKLSVTGTPADNDTLTLNSTVFTFKSTPTAATDIAISSTPYQQASLIVDVLKAYQTTLNIYVYEDDIYVYVRRLTTNTLSYGISSGALSAVAVAGINTVPLSLEVDVFRWWCLYMLQAHYRYLIMSHPEDVRQAEALKDFLDTETERLENAYTSMGIHG